LLLDALNVRNFRNYSEQDILWHPHLNIITGLNAQGKSNLLEAIHYLSVVSSFRNSKDQEIIRWGQKYFFIEGMVRKRTGSYSLAVGYSFDNRKVIRVNGNQRKKIGQILGILNTVLFSPEDLMIVKSSPAARRKYLDGEMIQLFPSYYYDLLQYQKIIGQKNNLLKEIKEKKYKESMLDIWDMQQVEIGSKIIKKRMETLKKLVPLARLMHRKLTDGEETLEISYETLEEEDTIKNLYTSEIKKIFEEKLVELRRAELRRGVSLIGPHRDDLKLSINSIDVRKYGSQGQQRTAALSLKMAELEMMKAETGEYPILLLDDVMSELDERRKRHLLDVVGDKVQTFITTTEVNLKLGECLKMIVSQGNLKKI